MDIYSFLFGLVLLLRVTQANNVDRHGHNSAEENAADEIEEDSGIEGSQRNPEYNSGKFEGDIVLAKKREPTSGIAYEAISREYLWENGEIPFTIDISYDRLQVAMLNAAMDDFHKNTCVRFRDKTVQDARWVHIFDGGGCFSSIGRQGKIGAQDLSLASECFWGTGGTLRHEMMHTIGFYHEQARTDRDNHIKIMWEDIEDSEIARQQFSKSNKNEVTDLGTEYDLDSLMHYGRFAFEKITNGNRPTIVALNGRTDFGQRNGFSRIDLVEINKLYNCPSSVATTEPHTFTNTFPHVHGTGLEEQCNNIDARKKMFLNGRCYVASKEKAEYSHAIHRCRHLRTEHRHLAFVTNRNLVNELYNMVLGSDQVLTHIYYVGAYQQSRHRFSPGRGWRWMAGSSHPGPRIPQNADVWRRGEPDDRHGHDERAAAITTSGGLDDVPEHGRFHYICEYHD